MVATLTVMWMSMLVATAVATSLTIPRPETCAANFDDNFMCSKDIYGMKLIGKLLERYEEHNAARAARPVFEFTDLINLKYGMSLIRILDFNQATNVISVQTWEKMSWDDVLLTWNPTHYGDITQVMLPSNKIWLPDMALYNSVGPNWKLSFEPLAVVADTGKVIYIPVNEKKVACNVTTDASGYRTSDSNITCLFRIGSWVRSSIEMDIQFFDDLADIDTSDMIENPKYDVVSTKAVRISKKYPCCVQEYLSMEYTLVIKQK